MTALEQVPAGVASRLRQQADAYSASLGRMLESETRPVRVIDGIPHVWNMTTKEWRAPLNKSAEQLAAEWLAGLNAMEVA